MPRPLIIVLNHDEAFLEMICDFLTEEGYKSVPTHEDHKAFELIKQRQPQIVFIELVITDPESGLMVLNKMRLHPETKHIPVIIASTVTQLLRDNEEHLRKMGCDILQKPFDLESLLAIVGKHVRSTN